MVTVKFYTTLRLFLKLKEIHLDSVQEVPVLTILRRAEEIVFAKTSKRFLFKLLIDDETIKQGTLILINGRNILDTDALDTVVNNGDMVVLFPPGGGG